MTGLRSIGRAALIRLARAIEDERIRPPYDSIDVQPYVPRASVDDMLGVLEAMASTNATPAHIAMTLRLLADERAEAQRVADKLQLVWSGTEVDTGTRSRDTAAIVQELFRRAEKRVIIASYVLDKGAKARAIFGGLASHMDENPALSVRIYINVPREWKDSRTDGVLLKEFADHFVHELWPGRRMPELYYDPRSLTVGGPTRASLHAKCIIVDDEHVLITSANFTEAAHQRNIEAGVRVDDRQIAEALRIQFETLVERNLLVRVPGI